MSRPKLRIHYAITVPGKWWHNPTKKWLEEPIHLCSNVRKIKTVSKAFRVLDELPVGSILHRFDPNTNGGKGWLVTEWVKVEDKRYDQE